VSTLATILKLVPAVVSLAKDIIALIREGVELKSIEAALEGMSEELTKLKKTKDTSGLENIFNPTDTPPK